MPSRGLVSASPRYSAVADLPGGLLPEFHTASAENGLPLHSLATYWDFHVLSPTPASPTTRGSRCRRRLFLKGRILRPGLDAWARVHCRLCWYIFLSHPSCGLSSPRFLRPQSFRLRYAGSHQPCPLLSTKRPFKSTMLLFRLSHYELKKLLVKIKI